MGLWWFLAFRVYRVYNRVSFLGFRVSGFRVKGPQPKAQHYTGFAEGVLTVGPPPPICLTMHTMQGGGGGAGHAM